MRIEARPANRFLAALSAEERLLLDPLERVQFAIGDTPVKSEETSAYFWFVEGGFFSISRRMRDGRAVEIGYVMPGGCMPFQGACDFVAHLPGTALRARVGTVNNAIDRHPIFRRRMLRAGRLVMLNSAQISACNRLHSDEERYLRRLLAMRERMIPGTQHTIAAALGISRQSLARIGDRLKGLIRHSRGYTELLDRAALEARTCECYALIEASKATLGQTVDPSE